jgi:3-polyprenyl-4-hydroxybenzoate decarboxylase
LFTGFIQAQVLSFSPSELLRLLQLHQQVHLRPSRACIKYMTAVLEQHLAQQAAALRQQQQQECGSSSVAAGAGSSSLTVLQLVMCVCGLSMWEVRLHLRSVAELIVLLEAHKGQLPLSVTLQVRVGLESMGLGSRTRVSNNRTVRCYVVCACTLRSCSVHFRAVLVICPCAVPSAQHISAAHLGFFVFLQLSYQFLRKPCTDVPLSACFCFSGDVDLRHSNGARI